MKVLFIVLMALAGSTFAQGRAIPAYGDAKDEAQQKTLKVIKIWKLAEKYANLANATVNLKSDVGIVVKQCDLTNAFFSPKQRAIFICTEFVTFVLKQVAIPESSNDEKMKALLTVLHGIFLHELAHAVIRINSIPITGREEDVADQFAALMNVQFERKSDNEFITPVVRFWKKLGDSKDSLSNAQLSNEHSLSGQRAANVACWALGGNAKSGEESASIVDLPKERRVRCAGEFAQLNDGIRRTFGKTLKF